MPPPLPAPLLARLERLTPDQRAAATAPPGPTLCIAPAGSGKTTTLIARICWLVGSDMAQPPDITAVTFNKRAAVELEERLAKALGELVRPAPKVRVRTFHALAREILIDAGVPVEPLADRIQVLRSVQPKASFAELGRLDTTISRLKLDLAVTADEVAADPDAGATARTFVAYERAIAATGGLDFDDLLVRGLALLERDPPTLARWRERCTHLLVDEAQDLDRSQLRLALLLAAPANRIFLVGDDDQSIYGWRLADVRRLLGLAETSLPDLRRVDLVTNFRCPAPVIERAVRLVEHNRERFAKTILARDDAAGRLLLVPSNADDVDRIEAVMRSWPDDGGTRAVLARTNRELVPAAVAAVRLGVPFAAPELALPVESPIVDELLEVLLDLAKAAGTRARSGLAASGLAASGLAASGLAASGLAASGLAASDLAASDLAASDHPAIALAGMRAKGHEARLLRQALLAWSAAFPDIESLRAAIDAARASLTRLRRDDALLTLATAHGTKGLEFDHVAVIGLDEGRFPSARSVSESAEPERALEEERRLAYVAWTRARGSLALVYDPGAPSQFLLEAFSSRELGLVGSLPSAA
jgi:superfamily I DNA/RNA helicase